MGLASWWPQRRFGMFVHANLATVPAFSPVGEYADWYWSHWSPTPLADVLLHPKPLPEVLAFHAEHYPEVRTFDDFAPMLHFERWDAGDLVDLARAAGMGYLVHVTKHHDGFCWWDAPGTDRSSVLTGPHRDVARELAEACHDRDVVFGTYHSLLDWGHPDYPDPAAYVDAYLHRQVMDLVERYGSQVLWGDGHWGHPPALWRSDELMDRARAAAARNGLELVVNDRWWASAPDIATYEYDTPPDIVTAPWELCRGVGHSFCHNRAETESDHMSGAQLVSLLTEVVAKGGNLLLNVGPAADGTVPELQRRPIEDAGAWVAANPGVIDGSRPWVEGGWGDAHVRFTVTPASDPRRPWEQRLNAVDVAARALLELPAINVERWRVLEVRGPDGAEVRWGHDQRGLVIRRPESLAGSLAPTYAITVIPATDRIEIPPEPPATPLPLLLDGAGPGTVVQLGAGRYAGPAVVPAGVTVRGAGADLTTISGGGACCITLSTGAAIEDVSLVEGTAPFFIIPGCVVRADSSADVAVRRCRMDGGVVLVGADRAEVSGCSMAPGGGVVVHGGRGVVIDDNELTGLRWGVGIEVVGGGDHVIERNVVHQPLCAIRLIGVDSARVSGNRTDSRWWGIHVEGGSAVTVAGNRAERTMRAVCVTGGHHHHVDANSAVGCDSGVLVEAGALDVVVARNTWSDCRVGAVVWASAPVLIDNATHRARDHDVVTGP